MLAIILVVGAVAGLGAGLLVRARERKAHPEVAGVTKTERFRSGWQVDRYSARRWVMFGLFFGVVGILELTVLGLAGHGGERILGILAATFFFCLAVVSLVQARRRVD